MKADEFICGCLAAACAWVFFMAAAMSDVLPRPALYWLMGAPMCVGFAAGGTLIALRIWRGKL